MALSNIASLSSVYIPLLNPPLPSALPGYLSVDRTSEWHTSALLSAAMETSTLPTRLHDGAGRLGRMDDLASFLNVNGGQKIAMLSMFVSGPEESPNANDGSYDDGRVPHPPRLEMIKKAGRINCSWGQQETKSWRTVKEDHVFAEANVARGFDDDDPEEPVQPERTGDRHEPIISSITSPLAFPLVDSFPSIFPVAPATTAHGNTHAAIHTRLASSSAVIARVKGVREVVGFRVGVEEREVLMNDLDEIVDGFAHGWMSDDDDDED